MQRDRELALFALLVRGGAGTGPRKPGASIHALNPFVILFIFTDFATIPTLENRISKNKLIMPR